MRKRRPSASAPDAPTLLDAESNKTGYEHDGHDRLAKTRYPDTAKGAGTSSATDYEQLTYDAGSNVTSRRLRDWQSIGYAYDNLSRLTSKDNVSGQRYEVSWFGSSLFTGPDTIRFRTEGSNSFVNETLDDHYFRYGTVTGTLSGNQRSGFLFSVRGTGANVSGFRASVNRTFGPEVFRSAARQMNQELLGRCGG